MPLYDFRCIHCEGIFEQLCSTEERAKDKNCPYCHKISPNAPLITGGHVYLNVTSKWEPSAKHEELTGPNVTGPGTNAKAKRTSILHTCKGYNCSLCP